MLGTEGSVNSSGEAVGSPDRLEALRRLELLDTPSEEAFDRLARIASAALDAPVALVSLVDEDRQFFKAGVGLEASRIEGRNYRDPDAVARIGGDEFTVLLEGADELVSRADQAMYRAKQAAVALGSGGTASAFAGAGR